MEDGGVLRDEGDEGFGVGFNVDASGWLVVVTAVHLDATLALKLKLRIM